MDITLEHKRYWKAPVSHRQLQGDDFEIKLEYPVKFWAESVNGVLDFGLRIAF